MNLVNFMDGLDWMTVSELVPITGAMMVRGWMARRPAGGAPGIRCRGVVRRDVLDLRLFNRPVAKVFLARRRWQPADRSVARPAPGCSSLLQQHLAAALLLPLYYLADATVTLLRRLDAGRAVLALPTARTFINSQPTTASACCLVVTQVFALNIGARGPGDCRERDGLGSANSSCARAPWGDSRRRLDALPVISASIAGIGLI